MNAPLRVTLDKVGSAAMLADIKPRVDLSFDIPAREGVVVAGRLLTAKSTYNTLEDVYGRMRLLMQGDIVAGVLGHRDAMRGYVGHVPESVKPGDILNVLNLGGVIGKCTSVVPELGQPFEYEVLGAVMHYPQFGERRPQPANIEQSPEIARLELPEQLPPIVAVAGVSMQGGKTTAVCELVRQMKRAGKTVGAGKCTGVSLLRDVLEMRDFGAAKILSFMDFGIITTTAADAPGVTRAIIRALAHETPDVILLELGDGILGTYGVAEILREPAIRRALTCTVFCASDPVGAWGGVQLLKERFGIRPAVITGPVTDNRGGAAAIERELSIPAFNARTQREELAGAVLEALEAGSAP